LGCRKVSNPTRVEPRLRGSRLATRADVGITIGEHHQHGLGQVREDRSADGVQGISDGDSLPHNPQAASGTS